MARDPLGEPLITFDSDRELQKALAIEPSPEFLARVREQIAREASPEAFSWRVAAACTAAAVVLIAGAVSDIRTTPARVPSPQVVASEQVGAIPLASVPIEGPRVAQTPRPRAASGHRASSVTRRFNASNAHAELNVIVPAGEQHALRQLFRRAPLAPPRLILIQPAVEKAWDAGSASALVIPPISIDPLATAASLEGDHQ